MVKDIINAFRYVAFNKGIQPFKTYFNGARFPSLELAAFYGDCVEASIWDGCEILGLVLKSTGEAQEIKIGKFNILKRDGPYQKAMDEAARSMLNRHEKKLFDLRAAELKTLEVHFKNKPVVIKDFSTINAAMAIVDGWLLSWTNYEKAYFLPLWLSWFFGVSANNIVMWYESTFFKEYYAKLSHIERLYINAAWEYNVQYLITGLTGSEILLCKN